MPLSALGGLVGLALAAGLLTLWQSRKNPNRRYLSTHYAQHKKTILRLVIAVTVGILLLAMTRLVAVGIGAATLIAVWPLAMAVTGRTTKREQEILEAIAVWTESLRDSVTTSSSVMGALWETTKEPPLALDEPLRAVHARLEQQQPIETILEKLSDDVDSHVMDHVTGALISNQRETTPGIAEALSSLAASIRQQVRHADEVAGEQRKYRTQVIAMLSVFTLIALWILIQPQWMQTYQTPIGQVVVAIIVVMLLSAFTLTSLLVRTRKPARFIGERRT